MIVRVLPLPAPANTSSGPSVWVTACICGSFSSLIVAFANLAAGHAQDKSARAGFALRSPHAALVCSPGARGRERRTRAGPRAFARRMRLLRKFGDAPARNRTRRALAFDRLLRRVRGAS